MIKHKFIEPNKFIYEPEGTIWRVSKGKDDEEEISFWINVGSLTEPHWLLLGDVLMTGYQLGLIDDKSFDKCVNHAIESWKSR